ncbi:MAG: ATP-binding protein, partial [Gemmatimonadaceae bacterium]
AVAARLRRLMSSHPAVVVLGPRQAGKSTLVTELIEGGTRAYISLDSPAIRTAAANEPEALLRSADRLTIDEVQREPELMLALKRAIDAMGRQRVAGQFLLTGSANLLMMRRVADSLAGRAVYLTLWPMTRRERLGMGETGVWSELLEQPFDEWQRLLNAQVAPSADWRSEAIGGGFPVPALELTDEEARSDWFEGYMAMYLERDLRELSAVQDLVDFRRLMTALALRVGNLVNQTDLGRDVAMSQQRVRGYLNLLETSYQLVRLQPYTVSRSTRLIKTPKVYWNDVGLALRVSELREPNGAHLENMILTDLLAWRDIQVRRPSVMYWRTAGGVEVDFVIETTTQLLPIEVKAATRISARDRSGLQHFLDSYPKRTPGALLLYDGDDVIRVADRILAVPWWRVI